MPYSQTRTNCGYEVKELLFRNMKKLESMMNLNISCIQIALCRSHNYRTTGVCRLSSCHCFPAAYTERSLFLYPPYTMSMDKVGATPEEFKVPVEVPKTNLPVRPKEMEDLLNELEHTDAMK